MAKAKKHKRRHDNGEDKMDESNVNVEIDKNVEVSGSNMPASDNAIRWADDGNGNYLRLLVCTEGDGEVAGFIFAHTENGFGIGKGDNDLREHLKPTGEPNCYGA